VFERQNLDVAKNIEKFMSTICRNLWLISKTRLEFAYQACTFLIKRKKRYADVSVAFSLFTFFILICDIMIFIFYTFYTLMLFYPIANNFCSFE